MTRGAREPSARYDRRAARWRSIVDWAKRRPWALRLVEPLSRGRGRFRFVDALTTSPARVEVTPDLSRWHEHELAACWLGHATVLLRVGEMTVLTDPVLSTRVGLGWGFGTLGPARFVRPAATLRGLPPIDLVLISHAHFDHLDRPTLARLARRSTRVVCAAGCGDLLDDLGFRSVVELPVGSRVRVSRGTGFQSVSSSPSPPRPSRVENPCHLQITALPVRHWGARIVLDADRGYCAMLIEAADGTRVLYGADSAYQEQWRSVGDSGGVDLAIVGIGAYDPWIEGHADPEQAWRMATFAGARRVLPMHHSTFKLSAEPMREPLVRFLAAAGPRAGDVVCRRAGEVWSRA